MHLFFCDTCFATEFKDVDVLCLLISHNYQIALDYWYGLISSSRVSKQLAQ